MDLEADQAIPLAPSAFFRQAFASDSSLMSDNSSPLHQRRAASSGSAAASAAAARRAEKEDSGSGSTGSGSTGSGTRVSSSRLSDGSFRYVDNYGLLVCLGEGGMGEVWAARDPKAPKNRVVALKLTKQQGAEAAKVLWDEARIASLIDHPNVCRVHELGMADGQQYLVMDYCDGASLHDLLERLPGRMLAPSMAARIVANVSAGLHAAHELCDEQGHHMGVVHRDVSPQNLLISTAGGITVADFGVARAAGQAHKATETGEMKGKLSYMAPEQVTSKDIDRRVDVFALGCVLYQVTLGKRPFHGEDALATLYQLLEKDLVRPTALDPSYPAELEQIVLKALAKDRNERFATAHELALALERFLVHSGQQVTDGDVARLLMERLGTEITARKEEIRRRAATLDKGPKIATGEGERVETEAGTVSETPPSARSTWAVRLMAGAVFLAVAGGSVFLLREPKVAEIPLPRTAPRSILRYRCRPRRERNGTSGADGAAQRFGKSKDGAHRTRWARGGRGYVPGHPSALWCAASTRRFGSWIREPSEGARLPGVAVSRSFSQGAGGWHASFEYRLHEKAGDGPLRQAMRPNQGRQVSRRMVKSHLVRSTRRIHSQRRDSAAL